MFLFIQPLLPNTALRGTRWALPPDSRNPCDDRSSQAYSMTLEDKAPVPPAALLHSPLPTEKLALSQPWGHCLTQAKTGCATCKHPNSEWSPKPLLTLPLFSCNQPYDPLALVERKPCPIITLYHTIYIWSIPSHVTVMSSSSSHVNA